MTPDEIEKDRSEGTSGPWRVGPVDDSGRAGIVLTQTIGKRLLYRDSFA